LLKELGYKIIPWEVLKGFKKHHWGVSYDSRFVRGSTPSFKQGLENTGGVGSARLFLLKGV